ncbi:MAG: hypothetical protein AAGB04_21445 [Pseudomonadota bacterium]
MANARQIQWRSDHTQAKIQSRVDKPGLFKPERHNSFELEQKNRPSSYNLVLYNDHGARKDQANAEDKVLNLAQPVPCPINQLDEGYLALRLFSGYCGGVWF